MLFGIPDDNHYGDEPYTLNSVGLEDALQAIRNARNLKVKVNKIWRKGMSRDLCSEN